jgi:hypothetical protein
MEPAHRRLLRQSLSDSNAEDMSIEFMVNPINGDYLTHIRLSDVLYTKQFYVLWVTDMIVAFATFICLIIVTTQINSQSLFEDGQVRYMFFAAIIGGSVALQPIIGWFYDQVASIRVMNFVNILIMFCLATSVAIFGPCSI